MLEELGGAEELELGANELELLLLELLTEELLLGAVPEELGKTEELDNPTEPLLGSSLPEEEDGSPPVPTLDDEPSAEEFLM
jgi:hypothetical protein